jgi:hypothetical protein
MKHCKSKLGDILTPDKHLLSELRITLSGIKVDVCDEMGQGVFDISLLVFAVNCTAYE